MTMRHSIQLPLRIAALAGGMALAFGGAAFAQHAFAQYTMTVNKDRLLNAQNEPQNWLMMNGDYGSTRYSKLSQLNRENVKIFFLLWAGALRDIHAFPTRRPAP